METEVHRVRASSGARRRTLVVAVLVLGLLVAIASLATAPVVRAAPGDPTTAAVIDGDAGDYISGGTHRTFTNVASSPGAGTQAAYFTITGADATYELQLGAPSGGQLTTGTYENAGRYGFQGAGLPGLSVTSTGRGCNTSTGRFVVDEITRDGAGLLVSFSARFEQHCEGAAAGLFGAVSYHATADYRDRTLSTDRIVFPDTVAGQVTTRSVVITNNGPSALSVFTVQGDGQFPATGCAGSTIAAGQTCTITVQFAPIGTGARTGALTIFDDLAFPGGSGTGRHVLLSGTAAAPPDPEGEFTPLSPQRILDTRLGIGRAGGPVGPGETVDVQITGRGGVPGSGVLAVVLNATVAQPSEPGYLTIWPAGVPRPTISNLNYVSGQTVPNLVTVAVGGGGSVSVFNERGRADVIFDVVGFYASSGGPLGSRFHPIDPVRFFDTRNGAGGIAAAPVGPGATLRFTATGRGGVPATGVTAVVMNVTVTQPSRTGYLTVVPDDVARPTASNLNFTAGQTIANLVVVRVPASGVVDFFNETGETHLLADVVGWFGVDRSSEAGRLITGTPVRLFDSRIESPFDGGALPDDDLLVQTDTPPYVSALVYNVTAVAPTAEGYLTVFPAPPPVPNVSNLNFTPGRTVPNQVIVRPGANGSICFANSAGRTHLIIDVFGYFTSAEAPPAVVRRTASEAPSSSLAPGA